MIMKAFIIIPITVSVALGCFLRRLLQVDCASVFAANVAPKKRLNGNGVTNKTQNCK